MYFCDYVIMYIPKRFNEFSVILPDKYLITLIDLLINTFKLKIAYFSNQLTDADLNRIFRKEVQCSDHDFVN